MDEAAALKKIGALDPYSIGSALKALKYAGSSSPEVASAAWRLVWSATCMNDNRSSPQTGTLVPTLFSCLKDAISNPRVQELGINSLVNLAQDDGFVGESGGEAAKAAIAAMEKHGDDVRVQEACVDLLERLVTCKQKQIKGKIVKLVAETGFRGVISALEAYSPSNRLICEKGVVILHTVVKSMDVSSSAKLFHDPDSVRALRRLMDSFYGTKENMKSYFKCIEIAEWLVRDPFCAKTLFDGGITGNVSQNISTAKCGLELLKAALAFLGTAATYGAEFAKFDSLSLTEWTIRHLNMTSDADTVRAEMKVLANIVARRDPKVLARFMELGGLKLAVDKLQGIASADIKVYASGIVWSVSYYGDIDAQRELLRLKAAKYVTDVLRLMIYSKKDMDQPLCALWSLTTVQENAELVRGADGLRLLGEALNGMNSGDECAECLLGTLWNMSCAISDPADKRAFPASEIIRYIDSAEISANIAKLGLGVLANVLPYAVSGFDKLAKESVDLVSKMMVTFSSDKHIHILCCDILDGLTKSITDSSSSSLLKHISEKDNFAPITKIFSQFRDCLQLRKSAINILHKVARFKPSSAIFVELGLREVISELRLVATETVGNEDNYDSESSICSAGFLIVSLLNRADRSGVPKMLDRLGFEEIVARALRKFKGNNRVCKLVLLAVFAYVSERPTAGDKLLEVGICKTIFEDILPKLKPEDETDTSLCISALNTAVAILAPNAAHAKYMKTEYVNLVGEALGEYAKNPQARFLLNTLLRKSGRTPSASLCTNLAFNTKAQCNCKKTEMYCEKCQQAQEGYRCNVCGDVLCVCCKRKCTHSCVDKSSVPLGDNSSDRFTQVFMPFTCSCQSVKCKDFSSQPPPQKMQKI